MARRPVALIVTLLAAAFVISLTGLGIIYFLVSREPSVPTGATLSMRIGGDIVEMPATDVVSYLSDARTPTVRSIVENLRKAKTDARIEAVLIRPTGFASPYWGKVQEIRDALLDFKTSGKPLYAYLEYGGDREYYLASAADEVFLMPASSLDLTGVATYQLFLKGTLDKIGAEPDLHHVGDYKTAVNQFTETGYTPEHREMDAALNRDLYEQIVKGIAEGRQKSDVEVRALIDQGPFLAEEARQAGLVDDLLYEDQVRDRFRDPDERDPRVIDGERYGQVSLGSLGLNRGPRIAVIYAVGAIVNGESGFDPLNGAAAGSDTLVESIRQAVGDSSVRAIVLRVDSPGGSATASDVIWRELMLARDKRPLVVSMSDLAASGGYYIAMPGHAIVAQPSTLTGSIGIFGGKFVTGGTYNKLGMTIDSTSIGKHAEMNSPARKYNEDEVREVTALLESFYRGFITKVANARGTTPEKIHEVAQGRVWTGRQAKEHGLVDELGGLDRAIDIAKEKAGIDADTDVQIVVYPPAKSFYELITEFTSVSQRTALTGWLSADELQTIRALRRSHALLRRGEPLALMPSMFVR
jgi:protease-4